MEYQKIMNLLDNIPNQSIKFRTKNWVEINDELRGTYNKDNQIGIVSRSRFVIQINLERDTIAV